MNEAVSVIIPVYNREKYIEECVSSVLEQSYPYFEIIIVDDGSTDNSVKICHRLAEKDSRIRFFAVEHMGVSGARNKALDEAKGEFLFFVDSDDVIHPMALESLVAAMREKNVSISAVHGIEISDSNWTESIVREIIGQASLGEIQYYTNPQFIEVFFQNAHPLGRMGGVMMNRAYVDQTRFRSDLRIGEDISFIYENILKGSGVAIVQGNGYYWRFHEGKSSLDATYSGFLARNRSYEQLWKGEEKFGRMEHVKHEKSRVMKNYISTQYRNKLYSQTGKQMRAYLKQHKKELFPAWDGELKRRYYLSVYMPWLYFPIHKQIVKHKKKKS